MWLFSNAYFCSSTPFPASGTSKRRIGSFSSVWPREDGVGCRTISRGIWANVRAKTLNMPPPPLDSRGVRRTEQAWIAHVLTGTQQTDTQQDIELKWNASYIMKYKHNRGDNLRTVEGHLRSDNPGRDIGKQQLRRMFQEYVRSPTCDELLRVHERDLKIVNYTTWTAALPVIRHELGLISSCDPYRVPRGFQFYPNDRILCPACHADPEAARQHAISLPFPMSREWFKNNTVQVMSIYRHYRAQHKDLLARHGIRAIPKMDCYACCAVCRQLPVEQRPQHGLLYTIRGLRDHYQEFHGVANPGLVDHPLNSIEIENSMEIKGCARSELRPRVF
ncbi:hypothetical protein GGG16DRAFT_106556 [Schizophyllum commune]